MNRYYDDEMGWGDIVKETKDFLIVRFDADPWSLVRILK